MNMKRKFFSILTASALLASVCSAAAPQGFSLTAEAASGIGSTVSAESDFVGLWEIYKAIEYGELMYDNGFYPDGSPIVEHNLYDLRADGTGEHIFYSGSEIYTTDPLTWSCSGNTLTMDILFDGTFHSVGQYGGSALSPPDRPRSAERQQRNLARCDRTRNSGRDHRRARRRNNGDFGCGDHRARTAVSDLRQVRRQLHLEL